MAFDQPDFDPVTLLDVVAASHEFHFTTRILPTDVFIEALEIKDGNPEGYEDHAIEPLETHILAHFGQLFGRFRKGLSQKHIEMGELGLRIADGDVVRGRVAWDDETGGRSPLLIIDGKPISWGQFGQVIMTYEGFNPKLEIIDQSEGR